MTNGEKMKSDFPDIEMMGESKDTLDYSLGGMVHRVTKKWWNAEYKEPSSSENPNLSENPISSTTKNGISNRTIIYKAKESKDIQEDLEKLEKLNESTTKTCETVDRREVINQIFYSTDNSGDVVLGSALMERIKKLPSVTPIRQKGHWIDKFGGVYRCSCCREIISIDTIEFPYGITYKYCPYCGSHNLVKIEKEGDKK